MEVYNITKEYDYSKFKFMKGNRKVEPARISKIEKSIKKVGYIPGNAVVVNEKFEICDGQARYIACKELNLPIWHVIVEGIGIEECIAMNASTTPWSLKDYISHYAAEGVPSYVFLDEQMGKHPKLKLSVIMAVCVDTSTGNSHNERLKMGEFEVLEEAEEDIVKTLEFLSQIADQVKKIKGRNDYMFTALAWIYRHSDADKGRLLDVIGNVVLEAQISKTAIGDTKQALQLIENAYNSRLRAENRMRFVVMYEDYQIDAHKWYSAKWGNKQ